MKPPPQDWTRALALLDEALGLHPAQRDSWLALTAAHEPGVMPLLNKLLHAHGRVETQALLATMPKVLRTTPSMDGGAAGMQVGPFELIEPLGRGGMGSVWRARYADARLKRDVAIKLPAQTRDAAATATLRERFARERDFLAQLAHPHIARLYDAGVSDAGQPYLAMEYVAGQSIDLYADTQRLTVKARLALFLQVLDAVGYAHQQLVLHRDLKAGNVLVDEKGQVRLLDFGVARLLPTQPTDAAAHRSGAVATELTERAGAAFTLGHAAPEQVDHGALSTATDVYALGVMLYRLLTGLSPYQPPRDTRGALEEAVLLATPASASSRTFESDSLQARQTTATALRNTLSDNLDVILAKALKKNPQERYATVAAFADDLRRHLAQQPISARADSGWYRASLFVARNRMAVMASSLAAVALVGTAGVAVWQARVSARNAALATKEAARANTAQKFFSGLLSNADPEKNKNISLMDRELADRALTTAERDFADDPETLAMVLKQLGDVYFRLGVPERRLQVLKKRVAVLSALPEAAADELLDAQLALGGSLGDSLDATDRAQALPMLKAAHVQAVSAHASPTLVVRLLCTIADRHATELKLAEANAYAAQAVEIAERDLPNPHPILAFAYEARAVTAGKAGQFDAARQDFKRALAVDSTGKGRGAVDQLLTRNSLAGMEYESGQFNASKREALAALEFARTQLGPTEGTLTPLRLRAVFASERAGDLDEAAFLVQQLLAPDLASGDAFRLGRALFAQGVVAAARGEFAAAAKAFSAAEIGLAGSPPWRRSLLLQVATLKLREKQNAMALDMLSPILQSLREQTGGKSNDFCRAAERTAVALARMGRLAEARPLFDEACAWRQASYAPTHPERARCEAYRILSSEQGSRADRRRALDQNLALLLEGRDDRMALLTSMRTAADWISVKQPGAVSVSDFPLLD
jgi:eukaryotic-like serine/threonine-protein kinase